MAHPDQRDRRASADGRLVRLPVTLDSGQHRRRAPGRDARRPTFVFANADDYAYALVLPDERTRTWLEENISSVKDSFLRAMLWGALWDLVREARLDPARFSALALRELPTEPDEQIVAGVLGRVGRAMVAYLPAERRDSALATVEKLLRRGAADPDRPYGIRKSYLDTYIRVAGTPSARRASRCAARQQPKPRARRSARRRAGPSSTALIERKAPSAERRLERESRADSGSEGQASRVRRRRRTPRRGGQEGLLPALLRRRIAQRGLGYREPRWVQHASDSPS